MIIYFFFYLYIHIYSITIHLYSIIDMTQIVDYESILFEKLNESKFCEVKNCTTHFNQNVFMVACKNPDLKVIQWVFNLSKDKIIINPNSDLVKDLYKSKNDRREYARTCIDSIFKAQTIGNKQLYNIEECSICSNNKNRLILITCGRCVCVNCSEYIDRRLLCKKSVDINN